MATTSLSLGEHWEKFIKRQIATGRYGSASEVVRDALRCLEDHNTRLEALRARLKQAASQAEHDHFDKGFSLDTLIAELDVPRRKKTK